MVNRAHNLQIVQVQLQNCNYFTNSAILFTKNARKIAFQRKVCKDEQGRPNIKIMYGKGRLLPKQFSSLNQSLVN